MQNRSPLSCYQDLVDSCDISEDPGQHQAIELLEQLYLAIQSPKPIDTIKGIYLWGKVGRGKTFLMDLFVSCIPSNICKRQHFHHFMKDVHQQLSELSHQEDPLKQLAKTFSDQYRVLCFDEFFVSDIGDAMLLGNLLTFLFELNIVVVCTSNCAPKELYKNGLQRDRFLPAIKAIEQFTQPLNLAGQQDHRHRTLTPVQNYFELPPSIEQQQLIHQQLFDRYSVDCDVSSENSPRSINILGREINYVAQQQDKNDRIICFKFSVLCQGPRSHFDYVELAKQFSTMLLFNVPAMSGHAYERIKARGTEDNGSNINIAAGETGERAVVLAPQDDAVRRFIALVDECYDSGINLILTSDVPLHQLYNSGTLLFEFERTKSRLTEMASQEYLDSINNSRK